MAKTTNTQKYTQSKVWNKYVLYERLKQLKKKEENKYFVWKTDIVPTPSFVLENSSNRANYGPRF